MQAIHGRRQHYIEEKIGYLEGLMALSDEYDLRIMLIGDIERGIERIASVDIDKATEHQLAIESKWTGEIESKFEKVSDALALAMRLLTKTNLGQLSPLLKDSSDIKEFKSFLSALPE